MQKIAFIFPGQGAQYAGMGEDLYENFPEAKAVFDKTDEILGSKIKQACFEGPEDMLKETIICQPAILAVSIAAFSAFKSRFNLKADYTAGLSLGEYSALVASGALKFEDALRLVQKRAELMEQAAAKHPGKMAAIIGLDKDTLENLGGPAQIANLNCPGQMVISGTKEAVDQTKELALKKGARRVIDLDVSGAFHSSLMQEAADSFKAVLATVPFACANTPVINNVDALPEDKPAIIKEKLVLQITQPVLWEASVRFMIKEGVNKFFEFGPGSILKGLIRRIDPQVEVVNIEKKEDILNAI